MYDAADLRAFARRSWDEIAAEKARFWKLERARWDAGRAWDLGDALRAEVMALRPDWPSAEERDDDLASHTRLARSLAGVRARADD